MDNKINTLISVMAGTAGGTCKATQLIILFNSFRLSILITCEVAFYAGVSALAGLIVKKIWDHIYNYAAKKLRKKNE